jgi:zinc-binding alcohol dehydrogenase/oxidoreductase
VCVSNAALARIPYLAIQSSRIRFVRAVVLRELGNPANLRVEDWPKPVPEPGEVVVRVRAAALNHRDVWIRRGQYAGIRLPAILGSDAAGEVTAAGDDEGSSLIGREVVIDPSFGWGSDPRAQSSTFHILGMPTEGTYAEFVKVPAANVYPKPLHLTFEEAAALPLAAVTAYRAVVTRAALQAGETVVITGIGGGVAVAAMTIAVSLGATVYVTSGSEKKIATAKQHGAVDGVLYHASDWSRTLLAIIGRRPDVIIDGAGGETFAHTLDLVRPGGRIVTYGATRGAIPNLEARRIFWKQLDIYGSTMGTPDDFKRMLETYAKGFRPVVDTFLPLDQAADAHARLESGEQFGKIVLRVG